MSNFVAEHPNEKNVDDDSLEMTDWPFLLPDDFEPCC